LGQNRQVRLPSQIESNLSLFSKWLLKRENRNIGDFRNHDNLQDFSPDELYGAIAVQPISFEFLSEGNQEVLNDIELRMRDNSCEAQIDFESIFKVINSICSKIRPRNKKMFWEYYGQQNKTLEEIGKEHGLTRERVRQVIQQIIDLSKKRLGLLSEYSANPFVLGSPNFIFDPRYSFDFFYNEFNQDRHYQRETIFVRRYLQRRLGEYHENRITEPEENVTFINKRITNFLEGCLDDS
jgi:RNA polymerase sigma factor (sigma-70 family)